MPMETRHDLEHTTERLTEGLRCPWKWGHSLIYFSKIISVNIRLSVNMISLDLTIFILFFYRVNETTRKSLIITKN